jgi:restriction system protein
MAKITPRRNGEFLRYIFALLMEHEEGMQAKDILAKLGENIEMTEFELGVYTSAPERPRYNKIARFATVSAVKAGWLIKEKGIWTITDEGREAYKKYSDPEMFYREAHKIYREWKATRPAPKVEEELSDEEIEGVRITFEQAEEDAWNEIRGFTQSMDPYDFQDLVANLLEAMRYHVSWIAPRGKDYGVDIIAYTDPLGATNPRIKVQVKRKEGSTSVAELRSFLSVLGTDDLGIFVCTGGFTKDAWEEARTQENRRITLIDLTKLVELWIEYSANLTEQAKQRLPLRPIYFLAPED